MPEPLKACRRWGGGARGWSLRLLMGLCVLSSLAVAAELPMHPVLGVCVERPLSRTPATGTTISTQLENLVQLSERRFLALLREEHTRVDRWADLGALRQDRQAKGVTSASLEFFKQQRILAILDRSGKVLKRSAGEAEEQGSTSVNSSTPSLGGRKQALLLALEGTDTCPYAVVERSPAELLCYDFDLSLRSRLPLGLAYVHGARAFAEGGAAEFWIFGTNSPPPGSPLAENQQEGSLGVRVQLTAVASRVTPLAAAKLETELEGALGARARDALLSRSLVATPFLDSDRPPPVRVLLHAGAAPPQKGHTPPMWHFFAGQLSAEGFGHVRRVPLRVEALGGERVVDEKEGMVKLPQGSRLFLAEAFSITAENWGMFVSFLLPAASPSGQGGEEGQRSWDVLSLLASFTGARLSQLLILDGDSLQDPRLTRALATRTHWVIPIFFMGRAGGPRELAFHAWGFARDKRSPSLPCAAILALP